MMTVFKNGSDFLSQANLLALLLMTLLTILNQLFRKMAANKTVYYCYESNMVAKILRSIQLLYLMPVFAVSRKPSYTHLKPLSSNYHGS